VDEDAIEVAGTEAEAEAETEVEEVVALRGMLF
jgi:hypothetical protein